MVAGYKEHHVDPRLAPYVTCYWTYDATSELQGSHPVMPDGCIDLLFESRPSTLDIVGTMTRTLWAKVCGPTQFVGVRFKAGGAVPFLRERADLLTNGVVEAEAVLGLAGSDLKQQLLEGGSLEERVRLLERFLVRRLQADVAAVDSRIVWATSRLIDDPGSKIESLACGLGMSRQYLRRLFLRHTGLSPKAFARVARLGRLVEALQAGAHLADSALASGYADQAHMTHEFKDLVGITPAAYQDRHWFPFVQDRDQANG